MIQALDKLAIALELILMELTYMFENSFKDAVFGSKSKNTFIHLYPHPPSRYTEKQPMNKGEAFPSLSPCHSCHCW